MIIVSMNKEGVIIPFPQISEGENASFTDYTKPETEIVVIKSSGDCGEVWISKSGFSLEVGALRIINTTDYILEKSFMGEYKKTIKTKYGNATLILKFQNNNDKKGN